MFVFLKATMFLNPSIIAATNASCFFMSNEAFFDAGQPYPSKSIFFISWPFPTIGNKKTNKTIKNLLILVIPSVIQFYLINSRIHTQIQILKIKI